MSFPRQDSNSSIRGTERYADTSVVSQMYLGGLPSQVAIGGSAVQCPEIEHDL
jgi:hypothetical protein